MRERTPIADLELQGNASNLARAQKRIAKEKGEALPLPPGRAGELRQIDELISQAFKNCKKGATRNKRPNPAFAALRTLVATREVLLRGFDPEKNSADEIESEIDSLLADARAN